MAASKDRNSKHTLELLEILREIPTRDPDNAARGKAKFLAEARSLKEPVSLNPFQRLIKWMPVIFSMAAKSMFSIRKERSQMFTAISSVILVLTVVLGGGGVTAYAAQDSLPNDLLYPVKLLLEDTRYALASTPEAQMDLLVSFANNRVDEIVGLSLQGDSIPDRVMEELQQQMRTMLRFAAGLDEEGTEEALQQIRQNLRTRNQLMKMLGQPEDVDPALEQLQAMLEAQHRIAQAGLDEPLQFRQMFNYNRDETPGGPSETSEPVKNGPGGPDKDAGHGNDDPGNDDSGNDDPGNDDPGNDDPGNNDPGNDDAGNEDPGNGSGDKGKGGEGGKP